MVTLVFIQTPVIGVPGCVLGVGDKAMNIAVYRLIEKIEFMC